MESSIYVRVSGFIIIAVSILYLFNRSFAVVSAIILLILGCVVAFGPELELGIRTIFPSKVRRRLVGLYKEGQKIRNEIFNDTNEGETPEEKVNCKNGWWYKARDGRDDFGWEGVVRRALSADPEAYTYFAADEPSRPDWLEIEGKRLSQYKGAVIWFLEFKLNRLRDLIRKT